MKRKILFIAALLGMILFAIGKPLFSAESWNQHAAEGTRGAEAHEEHDEEMIRLPPEELKAFGIEVAVAGAGDLKVDVSLPGEVVLNPDRFAHIVPRVPGVVRQADKNLGDRVTAGEVMAVLESRELSDLKSSFLAAKERLALAETTFRREETLRNDGISSEREYLAAKQALAEARIESRSAEQKLHALGFTEAYLKALPDYPDASYTRYEITAPFDGVVVTKHITLGENLKDGAEVFSVADLGSVWVMLTVYQKDLPYLISGKSVRISAREGGQQTSGVISYISPVIDEATRTAAARVVLPNPDGQWRPGLFVNGEVEVDNVRVSTLVPRTALQNVEGKTSVFVLTDEGFEPRPVTLGKANGTHVEITSGLQPGQRYAARGAFTLKAQLEKGAFGDGHAH